MPNYNTKTNTNWCYKLRLLTFISPQKAEEIVENVSFYEVENDLTKIILLENCTFYDTGLINRFFSWKELENFCQNNFIERLI